ncbi:hypothetical protein SAMN05518672_103703 [Chitinophaga sp. CF118]|uniref:hypothetical protein n=1 Tax=Chitinophaga sp. CF118 TaxID=1884367 RepID=UPI0008EB97C9|nr:hypothetical protein [Chitinophaga sp. CF118]SFD88696.1 hypothetical protein SAMN05518672_103703 [Chitinophaga sp. CF118]
MIEEADVRIGNLVWYYNLYLIETTFKVEGVLDGFIYNSSLPKSKLPLDKVNPVMLETDHLLAFGYVKGDKDYGEDENVFSYKYSHKDSLYIRDDGYSFQLLTDSPSGLIPYGRPIVHVHQLQNLHFCLTREELI